MKVRKTLQGTRTLLLAALLTSFAAVSPSPPALAGSANIRQFSSMELGLAFLDPLGTTESADNLLDGLFGVSGSLMSKMPSGSQSMTKPLADSIVNIKDQIMSVAKGKSSELQPYLQPYQVLDKSPINYEELNLPNKLNLRNLVEKSNDLLKQSSRISGTIRLTETLTPQLKSDLGKLNPANAMQKSALGIVAVSLANLNLGAAMSVDKLKNDVTELQGEVKYEFDKTKSAIASNPMNGLSMGEDLQVLTGLTETLPHASTDLAAASTKLPGIVRNLQGIIAELKK